VSGVTEPTAPIGFGKPHRALTERFDGSRVGADDEFLLRLRAACARVDSDDESLAESGRDWWPIALRWALLGQVPARPAVVARPEALEEVTAVLALCNAGGVPVTAAAGRSGVCGSSIPVFGGVSLDCCALSGIVDVDPDSLLVEVRAGTFGPDLERDLREDHGLTVGHWPQSLDLSTVGGWVACRSAGQYSTRYGKIEDIVAGLEVVLADGRVVRTGGLQGAGPRSATGPDLTQLFVGSEGTLGVITSVLLRAHPAAGADQRAAWSFPDFASGLDALRRILRRGATPAVLRLYDPAESQRNFQHEEGCLLVVLDEGDEVIVSAAMQVVEEECRAAARLDEEIVGRWLAHRNDVSALASVVRHGIVVDTIEVAATWSSLAALYEDAIAALEAVDGLLVVSAHESHAYLDGACVYFTFAGRGPDVDDEEFAENFYRACWTAVMDATRRHGGSISHHHGIGLVRGPFLAEALGEGFNVLRAVKDALDPNGVMNPGKLGLPSPFGEAPWR
jgi:alkyldihydroxyacetonephosphate synthase